MVVLEQESECSAISLGLALEAGAVPHPSCKVLSVETEAESGSNVVSMYCTIQAPCSMPGLRELALSCQALLWLSASTHSFRRLHHKISPSPDSFILCPPSNPTFSVWEAFGKRSS